MTNTIIRKVAIAALMLAMTGTFAACGKKVPLQSPEGATYPRQYPPPR